MIWSNIKQAKECNELEELYQTKSRPEEQWHNGFIQNNSPQGTDSELLYNTVLNLSFELKISRIFLNHEN